MHSSRGVPTSHSLELEIPLASSDSEILHQFEKNPLRFVREAALLFIAVLILGATAFAQSVTGTIPVGNAPAAAATNPLTNTIYVLNSSDGTVSVINGATGLVTSTISVGSDPVAVAVNPVTNTIYVANKGSADVTPIDGATNVAGAAIAVGTNPTAIAVNPVTNMIYVANNGSNTVTPIYGATNTAGSAIAVGTNPTAIAVNPATATNTVYVANYGSNTVTPINGATNVAGAAIAVGTNPAAIAVNPVTNMIYVANSGGSSVTPINGATNAPGTAIAAGTNPIAIAVNPVSNTIYVANNGSNNVTVINGTNNTPTTVTDASAIAPIAVALNLLTNTVYVANNGSANVTAINGATNTVATSPAAGTNPVAIAVNPVTGMAYVANNGSANVTVISSATYTVTSISDSSFSEPNAIAVNPVTNEVYVANNGSSGSDTITVINPASGNSVSTVTDSSAVGPTAIAVNPATNMIYVADQTSHTVTAINAGNSNQVTTITPPGTLQPVAIAVNPVTNIIYVANSATNNVTMISAANSNHVSVISDPSALGPAAVAVNSATGAVYVANSGSDSVSVFDGVTGSYVASITVGTYPQAIAVNPATNIVYVANSDSSSVTVINGATNVVTTTVTVSNSPVAVAVNPITNLIYVADAGNETGNVTVINGATNATTTITHASLLSPNAIAVNPTTNKIYVADYDGYVTAIDGVTNTPFAVTDTNAQGPFAVAVNPVTNDAYVANYLSDNATAVAEQPVQTNALQTAITALTNNQTSTETPTFGFTTKNGLTGTAADNLVYQFDSWTGPWTAAVRGAASGNSVAFSATVATPLEPGFHILYAFATDGEDGASVNTGAQSSPLIGTIAAYGFLVAPQVATAFPPALTFATQTQSTPSAAQTVYLVNEGEASLTFTYGFTGTNNTDFAEGSGDTCSTQDGTLAPGASCTVFVVFTPATTSSETASLVFTDNSNGIPDSTQSVALSGTGSAIPTYTLTIGESGSGSGTVSSSPSGITCQPTCSASYPSGTSITLTEAPGAGSAFGQWSGACTGSTTTCTFTITANATVTAAFNLTGATACTGTTTNWIGGTSGNWSNAANWVGGAVPASGANVCIADGTGKSSVTLNVSVTVGNLFIDSGSSLTISNNLDLEVTGTIYNAGQISVSANGNQTNLSMGGAVTLTGGGSVALSVGNSGGTPVIREDSGNSTLTNVNNTISGLGQVGNNGLTFINQAGGVVNATGNALLLNAAGATNQGLLEATGGGVLQVNVTVKNAGGTITAASGSSVQFLNGTDIQGGTLSSASGATLGTVASNGVVLDGNTQGPLTNAATYTVANNADTELIGTINNTGSFQVSANGNQTNLSMGGAVTLTGGGSVVLSSGNSGGTPVIREDPGNSTLTNVNNTISGLGQIGNNGLTFVNQAVVNANSSGNPLLINASGVINRGLFEATSGGIMEVDVTVNNASANITSNGSGSAVQFFNGARIEGGTLSNLSGATLGTVASNGVVLDGNTQGPLTNAATYTVANNADTELIGTINNTGSFQVSANGNQTNLSMGGAVTLTGGGSVVLSVGNSGGTPVIREDPGNSTLTNVNNTISGLGQIGNNGLTFVNQAVVNANSSGNPLLINASGVINRGLFEATSGGIMEVDVTVNNASANITSNGSGSAVQFFNGARIEGGTLSNLSGATLGTVASNGVVLDGNTQGPLTNAATYTVANNADTELIGTINNTGSFQVSANGNQTNLSMGGAVTLTGGGSVALSVGNSGGTPVIREDSGNSTLTNVNNTISGLGQVGNNGLTFINQAGGVVNAIGNALLLNAAGATNQGLLEATGGGILEVDVTVNNAGATITAANGSSVQFLNGTDIQGGTLSSASGATLGTVASNGVVLDGNTQGPLTNAATYTVANNADTELIGTINNTGSFQVSANGNQTNLSMGGAVTLTGGGSVVLSSGNNGGTPVIREDPGNSTLTNVNNTISGLGQIGNNGLTVVNQGTINANSAGATLLVNPSALTNQGLLESTRTGTLQLSTPVTNSGEIVPHGSPNPGTISISSNLTQASSGAEGVFIVGPTAGTQYSQLNVSGTASLSGALDVGFINGFMPASGNQFTVLTAGSITGTFSSINSAALPAGVIWALTYNTTSVVLTAGTGTSTSQTLTITELGTGSGTVTDNLGQINCVDTGGAVTGTCSASYLSGTTVMLTANPSTGTTFNGWSTCTGTGACAVTMNASQSVTATFNPSSETTFALTLTELGTGAGTVTDNSSPTPLINCSEANGSVTPGSTCSASYASGTPVTLTAAATSPSTFAGWGGACASSGTSATCSLTMNSAQNVTADFVTPPAPVNFVIPVGTNVTAMATYACPDNPNPTLGNPCTDPNGYAVQLTIPQVTSSFSLSVVATEFQADGLCPPGGNGQSSDLGCRFVDFFNYGTDPNGNTITALCWPYANGNCVHYDVYSGTPGTEPPTGSYSGPLYWQVAFNNGTFVPGAYWTGSTPRVLDNPDVNEFPGVPYGTNCSTAMLLNGTTTSPPIYCQFDQDITTFFNAAEGVDPTIGGKTPQANDVVVAFLPTSTGSKPVQTPPTPVAPTITGSCINGCVVNGATITFTEGMGGTFALTETGFPVPTLTESGTLPPGLTFNATTGLVSGTPTAAGSYVISLTATNTAGSVPQNFTLTINAQAALPTFLPVAGTYTGTQSVAINTTSGTLICYTTSSSTTPSTNGSACAAGTALTPGSSVTVSSSETLYAVAGGAGYTQSGVASAAYTINAQAALPTFLPVAGTYTGTQSVAINTTSGTLICYTTSSSTTPSTNGSACAAGTALTPGSSVTVSSSETLYAVAGGAGYTQSGVASAAYTITVAALKVTPTSLNFGTLHLRQSGFPQFVTVTNTGSTSVVISKVQITGGNAPSDYADLSFCSRQDSSLPRTALAPAAIAVAMWMKSAWESERRRAGARAADSAAAPSATATSTTRSSTLQPESEHGSGRRGRCRRRLGASRGARSRRAWTL